MKFWVLWHLPKGEAVSCHCPFPPPSPAPLRNAIQRKDTLNPQDIFLTEIGNEKELLGMSKNTGYLNTPSYGHGRMGNVRSTEIIGFCMFLRYPILGKTDMLQNIIAVL